MDPTAAQHARIAELKAAFGSAITKVHKPAYPTGIVRVEAQSHAGMWRWSYDRDGELVHASLDMMMRLGASDD